MLPKLFTGIAHFPNCLCVAFVYVAVLLFKISFAALLIQLGARAEARAEKRAMTRSNTRRILPYLLAAVQADLLCPLDDFEFISYFLLKAEEEERLDVDLSSSSESEQSWSSEREESAPVSDVSDVSTSDSEVDSAREAARKRRRTRVEVY